MPSDQSAKAQSRFQADRKPMPIQTAVRPPSTPRIFRLGDDYKKRQEKLKEELREDYRNAMAEVGIFSSVLLGLEGTAAIVRLAS